MCGIIIKPQKVGMRFHKNDQMKNVPKIGMNL